MNLCTKLKVKYELWLLRLHFDEANTFLNFLKIFSYTIIICYNANLLLIILANIFI